ncbi:MAG: hypothetical protein V3W18_05905 [candidate division Zixibacteria bacterium]
MKQRVKSGIFLLVAAMLLVTVMNYSQAPAGDEGAKLTGTKYFVISPHTEAECLSALDDILEQGEKNLEKWDWGCGAGDHTGYEIIDAESAADALQTVPKAIRGKARAMKTTKFTAKQIKSFHDRY